MKLLALNWRDIASPEAGGAEIHLHENLKRLVARGHEATVIASQFRGKPGPRVEVIDGIRVLRVGRWWNAHITIPRAARTLLLAESFDLLLDDVNKIPFFAPRWSSIPVVGLFHHLLGKSVFLETNPLFAAAILLYERQIPDAYRGTPAIAVSPSTRAELVGAGLRGEDITVIPPGIDLGLHRPGVCPRSEEPLMLVVSRLRKYKRIDLAIRAIALIRQRHPEARLAIIGTGPERGRLEALARSLDQPVTFLGQVGDDTKVRWLNRAHLLLNPSVKEGWGMVVSEAMATGTVPVVSDVPGHRDSAPEGAALRCTPGSARALAEAAGRILDDSTLAQRLRTEGRRRALPLGWDTLAAHFEVTLNGVLAGTRTTEAVGETRRLQATELRS